MPALPHVSDPDCLDPYCAIDFGTSNSAVTIAASVATGLGIEAVMRYGAGA